MTIGVLHRVEALADRSEQEALPPPTAGEVKPCGASGGARRTRRHWLQGHRRCTVWPAARGGSEELSILQSVPLEDIARAGSSLVAEAIARLRAGQVIRAAGYDGEYGVIRLFQDDELRRHTVGGLLFEEPAAVPPPELVVTAPKAPGRSSFAAPSGPLPTSGRSISRLPGKVKEAHGILVSLDDDQRAAAAIVDGPLVIVAGPGSGKTRTLTHRIVRLVAECGVAGEHCLAITFTRRAAAEMRERLHQSLGAGADDIAVHTFHSLGLAMLREHANAAGLQRGFRVASEAERIAALATALDLPQPRAQSLIRTISKSQRIAIPPSGEVAEARAAYQKALAVNNWIDFDDLIGLAVRPA